MDALAGTDRPQPRDAAELRERIERLEEHLRRTRLAAAAAGQGLDDLRDRPLLDGHATADGCRRLQQRFDAPHTAFYRPAGALAVSSLGIGTGRGAADSGADDAAYVDAMAAAMRGGINVVDTSLNYRFQRSEVAVGTALRRFIASGGGSRDEIVICTKGGFLVPGAFSPETLPPDEDEAGYHSIAAPFLRDQMERSRRNLGLRTIDVYFVHNPEVQLPFIGMPKLLRRLTAAFEQLERSVADGEIRAYGIATWTGLRPGAMSLLSLIQAARDVAGDAHRFRFLQLPFNRDRQEAATSGGDSAGNLLEIAAESGISVVASASLGGGAAGGMAGSPHTASEAAAALEFAISTPGIASALVGMRQRCHVEDNLATARRVSARGGR